MQNENSTNSAARIPAVLSLLFPVVLVFCAIIRFRLRAMPLERDEGEYAYAGQLLLQGIPPYRLAYNMKLPGIYAAYAGIFKFFGETPAGIHTGLLIINAVTSILVFWLAARLFGRLAGMVAGSSYALLSTSASVMGFEAHATNFVVLPAILAILVLVHALPSGRSWWIFVSGICAGVAVLMKQHGIFFAAFLFAYLVGTQWKQRDRLRRIGYSCAVFSVGVGLPYILTCWFLYRAGVFQEFWFWTVSYAGEYSKIGLHRAVRAFVENFQAVAAPAAPLWVLAAIGVSAVWWSPQARSRPLFLWGLLGASFLALLPGGYFRPHYFVLLLPVVAIFIGVAISSSAEKLIGAGRPASETILRPVIPTLVFALCCAYAVWQQRDTYFVMSPVQVFQATYPGSPFVPALKVADYVRENSTDATTMAVLGSEPEIYFYAERHSAINYIYMYSLIVRQKYTGRMRAELMRELDDNRPEYLVYVDVWDSWGDRTGDADLAAFLKGLREFIDKDYERVGVADMTETTGYVWGDAAREYRPQSSQAIYVLRRKSSAPSAFREQNQSSKNAILLSRLSSPSSR